MKMTKNQALQRAFQKHEHRARNGADKRAEHRDNIGDADD